MQEFQDRELILVCQHGLGGKVSHFLSFAAPLRELGQNLQYASTTLYLLKLNEKLQSYQGLTQCTNVVNIQILDLLETLVNKRQQADIVFMGHSFGGVLLINALQTLCSTEQTFLRAAQEHGIRFKGLVTLDSPLHGVGDFSSFLHSLTTPHTTSSSSPMSVITSTHKFYLTFVRYLLSSWMGKTGTDLTSMGASQPLYFALTLSIPVLLVGFEDQQDLIVEGNTSIFDLRWNDRFGPPPRTWIYEDQSIDQNPLLLREDVGVRAALFRHAEKPSLSVLCLSCCSPHDRDVDHMPDMALAGYLHSYALKEPVRPVPHVMSNMDPVRTTYTIQQRVLLEIKQMLVQPTSPLL